METGEKELTTHKEFYEIFGKMKSVKLWQEQNKASWTVDKIIDNDFKINSDWKYNIVGHQSKLVVPHSDPMGQKEEDKLLTKDNEIGTCSLPQRNKQTFHRQRIWKGDTTPNTSRS